MARARRYKIATQTGYLAHNLTRAEAQQVMSEAVRASAAECRRGKRRRCSVIGSVRKGSVKIVVGGRQGAHLWQRYVLNVEH
jgi:hypothetical protein